MKSYTDIEQSKELAEILPIDSADMCYIKGKAHLGFLYKEYKEFGDSILQEYEPCWSLAALIEQLPVIEGGKPLISLTPNEECDMSYIHALTVDYCLYVHASNLLDACVEMILKLKEKGLL